MFCICILSHHIIHPQNLKYTHLKPFSFLTPSDNVAVVFSFSFFLPFPILHLFFSNHCFLNHCLFPGSTRSMQGHCLASDASELSFLILKNSQVFELSRLRENQKHYKTFNHANSGHFLLTAWHLFKEIMLNRLYTRSYLSLLKRKHKFKFKSQYHI